MYKFMCVIRKEAPSEIILDNCNSNFDSAVTTYGFYELLFNFSKIQPHTQLLFLYLPDRDSLNVITFCNQAVLKISKSQFWFLFV